MKAKTFDKQFDDGADILASLDLSKAKRVLQEQKRVNIDLPTTDKAPSRHKYSNPPIKAQEKETVDKLPLTPKLRDALKFQTRFSQILPLALGMASAIYFTKIPFSTLITHVIPVLLACEIIVLLITCKVASVFLTKDGISYVNWRGRFVLCSWESPIEIKTSQKSKYFYSIKHLEKNKTIHVDKVIFSYPEIARFIDEYSPSDHKLRELIGQNL